MTERLDAICALLASPMDPALAREWLERGGHYQTCTGDRAKQDQWLRDLPLKYVVTRRMEREG